MECVLLPALKDVFSFRVIPCSSVAMLLLGFPSVSLLLSFPCNSVLIRGYASAFSSFRG